MHSLCTSLLRPWRYVRCPCSVRSKLKLQIMDPKMDNGFLQPGETLDDDYDTLLPLLPEEVLGVMDQLLCYEVAWHTGHPLSQTLFTSVYIDKLLWPHPVTLHDARFFRGTPHRQPGVLLDALRAYCLGVIKCCGLVIQQMQRQGCLRDEDFCKNTWNRSLLELEPLRRVVRQLQSVMARLQEDAPAETAELTQALVARLEFRADFLYALDLNVAAPLSFAWPRLRQKLDPVKATHALGRPVPTSFSKKIQRRLASQAPPRPIVELDFSTAMAKLEQLCTDCAEAAQYRQLDQDPIAQQVGTAARLMPNAERQAFLWAFGARAPPPGAFARSYLAAHVYSRRQLPASMNPFAASISRELELFSLPCSMVLDATNCTQSPPVGSTGPQAKRLRLSELFREFLRRSERDYARLWHALTQSRYRLRRELCHVVRDLDEVQYDATIFDLEIAAVLREMPGTAPTEEPEHPLALWTYHCKLQQMERVILLGFEDDLYLVDEWAAMYMFLARVSRMRSSILEKTGTRFKQLATAFAQPQPQPNEQSSEVDAGEKYNRNLIVRAMAIRWLSTALQRFYTLLLYLGLVPVPQRPFSTPKLRYELRMKPFLLLRPDEVLPFEEHEALLHPYGPYTESASGFLSDLTDLDSRMWLQMEGPIQNAKLLLAQAEKLGAGLGGESARPACVEQAWEAELQDMSASCTALEETVAALKAAIQAWDPDRELEVTLELPREGRRRCGDWWMVPKMHV